LRYPMYDIAFVAVAALFFVVTACFVIALDRI
jgi:hypothetical protein